MVALFTLDRDNYFCRIDSTFDRLFSGNDVANALINLMGFYAESEADRAAKSMEDRKRIINESEWLYCGRKTYNYLTEKLLGICKSRRTLMDVCNWLEHLGYLKIKRPNKRTLHFYLNYKSINTDLENKVVHKFSDFKLDQNCHNSEEKVRSKLIQQLDQNCTNVGLNLGQVEEDTLYINRSIEILLDRGSEEILNSGEGESKAVETQPISPVNEAKIEAEGQGAFRKENNETVPPARNIKVNNASHKDKENDPLFVSVAEEWGKTPKEVYEGFKGFVKQSVGNKANNPEAYAEGTIKKAITDPDNNQLWQDYLKANKPPATEPSFISLLAAVTEFKCHYSSNSSYAIQRVLEIFKPFNWTFEDFLAYSRSKGYLVGFPV